MANRISAALLFVSAALTQGGCEAGRAGAAHPPQTVEEANRAVIAACVARDASRFWVLLSPAFREGFEKEAESYRAAMDEKDLREIFGYQGERARFDGKRFLVGSFKAPKLLPNSTASYLDPCMDVEHWTVTTDGPSGRWHVFVVRRSDGYAVGLRFAKLNDGWYLDDITKPVKIKE